MHKLELEEWRGWKALYERGFGRGVWLRAMQKAALI
jgi:hypothetical protein